MYDAHSRYLRKLYNNGQLIFRNQPNYNSYRSSASLNRDKRKTIREVGLRINTEKTKILTNTEYDVNIKLKQNIPEDAQEFIFLGQRLTKIKKWKLRMRKISMDQLQQIKLYIKK